MLGISHSMAASRSTRVTRSTVGINGLDENFCGRTLRNRSIAHPEDIPPHSLLRSKSPKKRPEPVQPQKSGNGGRSADSKLQSTRESWVNPKKRGLSTSEKDNAEKETVENCEKKQTETVSPILKRSKRLRSEAAYSSEEDSPVKTEKEERPILLLDKDADSPGTKQAHQCLLLDDSDKREVKKVKPCEEVVNNSLDEEELGYQIVNGVDDKNSTPLNCDDCEPAENTKQNITSTGSFVPKEQTAENGDLFAPPPLLLSSSKEYAVSDHNVPCTNSQEQVKLEDDKLVNDCLPDDHAYQASESTTVSCAEIHPSVRDFEGVVDVVRDSSASKEQCAENTPSNSNPDHDTAISGEPEPPSGPECASAQMASLSEPQEHRYALRTSPRRAACTKGSPYKCNSPCREKGPDEADKLISSDKNVATSIIDSGSPMDSEETDKTQKGRGCNSEGCTAGGVTKPSSEARLITGYVPSAKESTSLQTTEEEEEDPDVYYFESDHVALKHNKDYQRLLQTIAVLEAQRTQSVQDLECLDRCQRESLKDPVGFVENLQKKAHLGLPCPQRVVQLPEISWDQYTTSLGNFEREFRNRKRNTRRVKLIFDKVGLPVRPKSPLDSKKDSEPQSYSVLPLSDCPESSTSSRTQQMIRGRLCDETKPGSFNQLWTVEEQKKLEQLLLKYPPEEVESRRWQKIADELGNRTAKQVASRVQKYFIKLTKAGIPVPGRTPNLYMYSKKSSSRRQHPLNKHLFKPSTFMTSHEPPVYMDEDDDRSTFYNRDVDAAAEGEASDEESIPPAYRELAEYKELLKLKKLKKQKLQQIHMESSFVQHVGFKCDNCGTEPIQGIRWHCQDCPPQMTIDFCDSCSDCLHETETHKEDHQLEPVYRAQTFLDRDYCMSQGTSYNYLDPNYFPANR